jgi:mRNA interferase MazF
VKRGEIYVADLPTGNSGHELQGPHPAIIFTNNVFNANTSWRTIIVVPISSSPTQAQRNYGSFLPKGTGGLTSDCIALCHQITTIDRSRLVKQIGFLSLKELQPIETEMRIILYL